jgi:hypothetical protein
MFIISIPLYQVFPLVLPLKLLWKFLWVPRLPGLQVGFSRVQEVFLTRRFSQAAYA